MMQEFKVFKSDHSWYQSAPHDELNPKNDISYSSVDLVANNEHRIHDKTAAVIFCYNF
ncbi:MAG: hypothetical protein GY820_43915 [Gammaproteobacteria bacterium]|nr:hypothetical protein [Gammaproteobacteria bacterium]